MPNFGGPGLIFGKVVQAALGNGSAIKTLDAYVASSKGLQTEPQNGQILEFRLNQSRFCALQWDLFQNDHDVFSGVNSQASPSALEFQEHGHDISFSVGTYQFCALPGAAK